MSFRGDKTATDNGRHQTGSTRSGTRDINQPALEKHAAALSQQRRPVDDLPVMPKRQGGVSDESQKPVDPLFVPRSDRFFSVRQSSSIGLGG